MCFSSHYRNNLNFTFDGAKAANISLIRLKEGYQKHLQGNDEIDKSEIDEFEKKFHEAINDDLNMPMAMGIVWDVVKYPKKSKKLAELLLKFDEVLGLKIDENVLEKEDIPEEILKLVEERKRASENKDWALSDKLRDIINAKGYNIKDTKDGTEIEKV